MPERGLDGRAATPRRCCCCRRPRSRRSSTSSTPPSRQRTAALADDVVAPLQREWEQTLADAAGAARTSIAHGLIAHYELDGNFSDISGRYQHGRTVTGDPTFDAGQIGRAASFDGDTEVSFGNVGAFDRGDRSASRSGCRPRGNLPMSVFQKLDDADAPPRLRVAARRHRARRHSAMGRAPDDHAGLRRAGRARSRSAPASGSSSATGITSADLRRLGQGGRPAPVRRTASGSDVDVVRDALTGPIATDAPLRLGQPALGQPFIGQIDDLRLYNRALAADEIEQLAHALPAARDPLRRDRQALEGRGRRICATTSSTYAAPEALRADARRARRRCASRRTELEKAIPTAMVMAEMAKPRDTFVLARGDYRNQTEKVQPGVPAMLPPLPKRRAAQPADAGAVAGRAGASAHRARRGEPLLADVLRLRHRQDAGGLRRAGRAAGRIRSCSTGWRPSSCARAGTSGRCSG